MKIGYIGLGKMGKNMVLHLLEGGVGVVTWDRTNTVKQEITTAGGEFTESLTELVSRLKTPRVIWLMITAGKPVDEVLQTLTPLLTKGDLVIDGGNSFYKDSIRRTKQLQDLDIDFMDVGVSGGPGGARIGACLMVGGKKENYEKNLELFKVVAAPEAFGYFGEAGSGHFAKMVHNGIEYGMMEAIAEGAAILKKSNFKMDLGEVFRVYNQKSVIESRLVGWAHEAFNEDPDLVTISPRIQSTGEGEWTVNTAHEVGVDVPVIEESLTIRKRSESLPLDSDNFSNKVVSALRGQFGQHNVKKN